MSSLKVLGIIPARYASTRFPGKPLVHIHDKPMIQHVYERALLTSGIMQLVVATDDERIKETVENFGGNVILTSSEHRSGTDRCREVIDSLKTKGLNFDIVLNIQGDEPFVEPKQLEQLIECFSHQEVDIATLIKNITDINIIINPNVVKVVVDKKGKALYFSRSPIPYVREKDVTVNYYKHLGLYAYKISVLESITNMPQSMLEKIESLEQLRWLENGYNIYTSITDIENIAIDTPEDLAKIK